MDTGNLGAGTNEADLFAKPKIEESPFPNNPKGENLRRAAAAWIERHPDTARLFLRFARELASKGRRFGVGLIAERVRYERLVDGGQEKFKVNNNHRAYIARWMIAQDQGLAPFLKFRKVRY